MEEDYHKVTSELDAREILRYLNELGIHNINGEVLKYFITDLKKYIKYDLQKKHGILKETETQGLERLHSASTFSSRIRSRTEDKENLKCSREYPISKRICCVRTVQSAPNLASKSSKVEEVKPLRRACSCVRVERKAESTAPSKITVWSANLIKVPKQETKKKCDPVSLYHQYTSLWAKFKPNLPGENNWADLRWEMRQKMAGCSGDKTHRKVSHKQKVKEKQEDFKL